MTEKPPFHIETIGSGNIQLIWGHGWGQSHAAFLPLVKSLQRAGTHHLIDFPGFGQSSAPQDVWGTKDYADCVATWLKTMPEGKKIWLGHSFGGRVGLQLAAHYPELIDGMFLIGAAGLKPKRKLSHKLYYGSKVYLYKFLKTLIPTGLVNEEWLYSKFGSRDYRNAGEMRAIFVKTVQENLEEEARAVKCPVHLVYGSNDTEAPPEIGQRLANLIEKSQITILDGEDHYTPLSKARHQVAPMVQNFITALEQ